MSSSFRPSLHDYDAGAADLIPQRLFQGTEGIGSLRPARSEDLMARITPADSFAAIATTDLGQGDRINLGVAGIMSRLPDVAAAIGGVTVSLRETGALSPRLAELVRLRIAFHNQCRSCMSIRYQSAIDDGLTEDAVCSLERPADAPDLTDAERSALRFADLFATNHLAIDDAVYDDVRRHFSEDQLVALGLHCALCVGLGRLAATWHVVDDLPAEYQTVGDTPLAPWSAKSVVASG
jgi:AhpD family alkylhydroperoxidase